MIIVGCRRVFRGENFEKNLALVERVKALAKRHDVSAGQLALAWVSAQGEDIVPIPGTKRRTYLEQNVEAAQITLGEQDLTEIADAMPRGVASGDRYPASMMPLLNR